MWFIPTMDYYRATRVNKLQLHAPISMPLTTSKHLMNNSVYIKIKTQANQMKAAE